LLQGAPLRSDKNHLARFSRSMPVYKKTRERKVYMAFGFWRSRDNLSGATFLSAVWD
jgi:hypothetical protein